MKKWLIPILLLPLLAPTCGGGERVRLTWEGHQFFWVRSAETDEDSVIVMQGELLDTVVLNGQRLYFVESRCTDWREDEFRCANSYISLSLVEGVEYDVVGWTEPGDRRMPSRSMDQLHSSWTCCNGQPPDSS